MQKYQKVVEKGSDSEKRFGTAEEREKAVKRAIAEINVLPKGVKVSANVGFTSRVLKHLNRGDYMAGQYFRQEINKMREIENNEYKLGNWNRLKDQNDEERKKLWNGDPKKILIVLKRAKGKRVKNNK